MDIVHFNVTALYVLNVEFIPLFKHLNELLLPRDVGVLVKLDVHHAWVKVVKDLDYLGLAVPYFHLSVVCNIIGNSINGLLLDLFKEHSSAIHLLKD